MLVVNQLIGFGVRRRSSAAVFPTIVGSPTVWQSTGRATSRTVTLPSGIVAGDLVIMFLGSDTNSGTAWAISGWSSLYDDRSGTRRFVCLYHIATGPVSTSATLTSGNNDGSAIFYRISGRQGNPEASSTATGTSTAPNPGNLSPSWGAADTLWFAHMSLAYTGSANIATSAPSGFAGLQNATGGSGGEPVGQHAVAYLAESAASKDPGAFTIQNSVAWGAKTIAIRPA